MLIDTANLSPAANWATEVDRNAVEKLEAILKGCGSYDRNETFEKLMAAKSDVSKLTAEQILRKDAKVVAINEVPSVVVAAFPLSVEVSS